MPRNRRDEDRDDDMEEEEGRGRRRSRSQLINDDDVDDEEEEEYGGGRRRRRRSEAGSRYIDMEVEVDDDDEDEEDEAEDGFDEFIVNNEIEQQGEGEQREAHSRPLLPLEDEEEDIEAFERSIHDRFARVSHSDAEYDEDAIQQALLPSFKDPKLWMVKCAIGREREAAVCLMQKCIDKPEMQIRSVIALDHLQNYIYVEADKEAHVREACEGMRAIYINARTTLVPTPIKEMTDVLTVEHKVVDISRDSWVRMKIGVYKDDLAKVVDVDSVQRRVIVKLVPRIDLQSVASRQDGREAQKKAFRPVARLMTVEEAREMNVRVARKRDQVIGNYLGIGGMKFKDGFLYKTVSMKSISSQIAQPTFDEMEKFCQAGETADEDMASLSTLLANRKTGLFLKGDRVIVIKGDLINLKGKVEKVEESTVHVRPDRGDLTMIVTVKDHELCKYFDGGDHVKVVSGVSKGATGMVVKVEGHIVTILSNTNEQHIDVFADSIVKSSELSSGVTSIGNYELRDLVMLNDMNTFGVIIGVESETLQVLKGVPDRPQVSLVTLRDIKCKLERKSTALDRNKNTISAKDNVKIFDGPSRGKQGSVEHVYKGVLFINDRCNLEHAGFICTKSQDCMLVGGSRASSNRDGGFTASRFARFQSPSQVPQSSRGLSRGSQANVGEMHRGVGGNDSLVGRIVKIRQGCFKGYRGRVKDIKGSTVRVELESQMKVVTVERHHISDSVSTPQCEVSRYGLGSETPVHPSRTPLHPYMTPLRDPGATPNHDGMRMPMHCSAWNIYSPMSPTRDNWEEGNPASWGTGPRYQSGSPRSKRLEAPSPCSSLAK